MAKKKGRSRTATQEQLSDRSAPRDRSAELRFLALISNSKRHSIVVGVAVLLTVFSYSNALSGGFVYDDNIQIVKNETIQHDRYFRRALTSDVWAFSGEQGEARSNYWRPAFITWLMLNYRLFGLNPVGWHMLNVLAHLLVTLLCYWVLVALQARMVTSAIGTWLFAAHPVHVQSVTWVSGVPDVLMSGFLLGSFLFYLALRKSPRWINWGGALACYIAALFSKETAIVYPGIVFLSECVLDNKEKLTTRTWIAFRRALPFLAFAVFFAALRYQVLHVMRQVVPGAPEFFGMLLTVPAILLFYVKQTVLPLTLGPIHAIRFVNGGGIGLSNFVIPTLVLVALTYGAYRLVRRDRKYAFGFIFFLLPLIPVLDARIFAPEMLVQERYLYLPLFGALIVLANGLVDASARLLGKNEGVHPRIAIATALALAIGFALLARQYNSVWRVDIALWEHAIRVDPSSAVAYAQLGDEYQRAGRLPEAKEMLSRALEIRPDLTTAHISLGIVANREKRYDEAEHYLKTVLSAYPDYYVALEQLGLAFQQQGKVDDAIALFDQGRARMPSKFDSYSVNIAVLHAMANRRAEAQAELELLIPRLASATDPEVIKAWWYLGELYREQGRADQARSAYDHYLKFTEGLGDSTVLRLRQLATQAKIRLK